MSKMSNLAIDLEEIGEMIEALNMRINELPLKIPTKNRIGDELFSVLDQLEDELLLPSSDF